MKPGVEKAAVIKGFIDRACIPGIIGINVLFFNYLKKK